MAGQRNAIDGRIVEIVAELDRDQLWGVTGARSVPALVAWKMGCSPANAHTIATVARRLPEFPRCARGMREGRLSLDQVGVIAARAGEGSDAHYAELAGVATVNQLRTALKLEPRPEPEPDFPPDPRPSISKSSDEQFSCWRIKLPHVDPAVTLKRFGASRISFVLPAGGAHPLPDGLRTPPSRSAAALRTNWGRAFACSARVRHWAGSSTTPPPTKLTITRCSQTRCPRRLRTPPVPSGRTDGRWLGCPRCGG